MAFESLLSGPRFQNAVLELLQGAESALLRGLHAIGLAPIAHGQPAWPFAQRLATETLVIDGGLTRQVVLAIAAVSIALALGGMAAAWRRPRWPLLALAAAVLAITPWPAPRLLLVEAHPTSFHHSPTGFDVASVERGMTLYQTQCAACHGSDGKAQGPLAENLGTWPPRLSGALLWRRAEGDTFWHILHGMHDRHGAQTMPAFEALQDADIWALVDAMKVIAAGTSVREDDAWAEPVRVPDAWVRCDGGRAPRRLSSLRGQRLRLVAIGAAAPGPREDPRLLTIGLAPAGQHDAAPCAIDEAGAYQVFAQVSGAAPRDFAGAQLIVDRDGWLRAYGRPGKSAWSQGDLLCRSTDGSETAGTRPTTLDGLGDLIAAIDADPIRSGAMGVAHRR